MHQIEDEKRADLFLTKACQEVWAQRISALAGGAQLESREFDASAFCYALTNGRVVFGIPLYELEDSYLIAMPAVLVNDDGVIKGTSMVSEPLIRLFKSNLIFVSPSSEKHLPAYYAYLYEKRRLLQGLVSEESLKDLEAAAKEHLVASAFTIPEDESDSIDDGEEDSKDNSFGSTMVPYYNRTTRH